MLKYVVVYFGEKVGAKTKVDDKMTKRHHLQPPQTYLKHNAIYGLKKAEDSLLLSIDKPMVRSGAPWRICHRKLLELKVCSK